MNNEMIVERTNICNAMIESVAKRGRRFFYHHDNVDGGRYSFFLLEEIPPYPNVESSGGFKISFVDHYSRIKVNPLTEYGKWAGFTNGSTLRRLIYTMYLFIIGEATGENLLPHVQSPNFWDYDTKDLEEIESEWRALLKIQLEAV